jgi:hypothetical protein
LLEQSSALRAIHTLNPPPKYIRLLWGLLFIHSKCWRGAQGLMCGAREPFPLVGAMVVVVVMCARPSGQPQGDTQGKMSMPS